MAVDAPGADHALQRAAGRLGDLGDDPSRHRLDVLIGERALARLQGHLDGDRLLARAERRALEQVEDRDAGDQLAVGALGGAHDPRRGHVAVDDEGEVAPDRLEVGELQHRLGPGRLLARRRNRLEDQLEAGERPFRVEKLQHLRVELAEGADDGLRPLADRARAAGMIPGRRLRRDLHLVGGKPERIEQGQRIGLGVEDGDRRGLGRPVAAAAGNACRAAPDGGGGGDLILGPVAAIGLADLEEGEIADAAIGIALGRGDEAGKQARPHVRHVGGDRIGEHQRIAAAAEGFRAVVADEGPGDRLDQAAGGERPLGPARAGLDEGQQRLAGRRGRG